MFRKKFSNFFTRSGCRPTYQAPQNSYTDDFEDFGDYKQRERPRHQKNNNSENSEEQPRFYTKPENKPKFQRSS